MGQRVRWHETVGFSYAAMVLAATAVACGAEDLAPAPGEGGGGTGGAGGQGGASCSLGGGALHVVQLAAGSDRTCAVISDGSVYCWGVNDFGEAGVSSLERVVRSPSRVEIDCVRSVSIGVDSVCAIREDDLVHCWGNNDFGQLGHDEPGAVPAEVVGLGPVQSVAAGSNSPAALLHDGTVLRWGGNLLTPRPPYVAWTNIYALPSSGGASCVVASDRTVLCVGENSQGQLGDGTTTDRDNPVQVVGLQAAEGLAVLPLATCSRADDKIACWGKGALGDGTMDKSSVPVHVLGISQPVQLSGDTGHWCAVQADDEVKCWGAFAAQWMSLPADALEPIPVPGLLATTTVVTGAIHSCALARSGHVYCWGTNTLGQLGVPGAGDVSGPIRVRFPFEDP